MKAVILAGGEGKRLRPLTENIPKTLIELPNGETILSHTILSLQGFCDEYFIVVFPKFKKKVEKYLSFRFPSHFSFKIIEQERKTGTMGALNEVKEFLDEEPFFVVHGDDYHLSSSFQKMKGKISYGVSLSKKVYNPHYYAFDIIDGFLSFPRKQNEREKNEGALILSGMYILDKRIFSFPQKVLFNEEIGLPQTLFQKMDEYPLEAFIEEVWYPLNTHEDLKKLFLFLQKKDRD